MTSARACALAFLVAGSTLALQVLLNRLVAAKLVNNYAFLVISLTMLGFAVSGVFLTAARSWIASRLNAILLGGACLMALSTIISTALFTHATLNAGLGMSRVSLVRSFLEWSPYALLLTVPFACAGAILAALLSDERLPTRHVYFFDLIGSALGALIVLPLFRYVSVESMILLAMLGLVVGTAILLPPRTAPLRSLALVTTLVLVVAFTKRAEIFEIYYPEGSMLAWTREPRSGVKLEYIEWDPVARIEVSSFPGVAPNPRFPSLFGQNLDFYKRFRKQITQNNFAFTYAVDYDGTPASLKGIEETIYASAYYATATPHPKVLTIGVGGGFDILTALNFEASSVTGVEINAATVNVLKNVYKDYFRHWISDPRVNIVNAEGRHYLSTSTEKYDVIQLSGVDSYSGTPGAAHVFSENYLYTAEAFDLYLSRLSEGGVLNMMRLEHRPEREMLRALTTAVAALRRMGVQEPRNHVVTVTEKGGGFTAMLVKRTPFSAQDLSRLRDWVGSQSSFAITAEPDSNDADLQNAYQEFLALRDPGRERLLIARYPFAIEPTVDDRPFFFNFAYWWHLFPESAVIWLNPPVLQMSLLLLSGVVSVAAIGAVLLPLALLFRRGVPLTKGAFRFAAYFAGTAVGYLGMEIALMQMFGLFLGHPNYAISVVLAALLMSSGIGALGADAIVMKLRNVRFVAYLLAALVLVELLLVLPMLASWLGLAFWIRATITVVLIFPIGVCLGVFLPTALEQLKRQAPHFVPWAWGVNGVFSVLAPLLAVAVATTYGISLLWLATVPIYVVIAFCLPGEQPGRVA